MPRGDVGQSDRDAPGPPGYGQEQSGRVKSDEVKAAVKDAGGAVKDAAIRIKDALKGG